MDQVNEFETQDQQIVSALASASIWAN